MAVAELEGTVRSSFAGDGSSASRGVRVWLHLLAGLVVLMVVVGGATRLTGSGLSITEWKPVTGALPPLSEAGWAAEFDRYRLSSQYRNLNVGMSPDEFRSIYWWEWSHRQLGRLIGLAFCVPLAVFWLRGAVTPRLATALLGIGALGGLQAAVGWIMVASGLEPGMVAVAPLKLMLHLVLASLILGLLVWIAAGMKPRAGGQPDRGAARMAAILVGAVVVQVALGGLVAGSHAGLTYNTWPLMDGRAVPPAETLFPVRPLIENLVDSPALVQFNHRLAGYAVVLLALWHMIALRRRAPGGAAAGRATGLALLGLAQMALGITTLVLVVPLWAGLAHQLLAMGLLMMAVAHAAKSRAEARQSGG